VWLQVGFVPPRRFRGRVCPAVRPGIPDELPLDALRIHPRLHLPVLHEHHHPGGVLRNGDRRLLVLVPLCVLHLQSCQV